MRAAAGLALAVVLCGACDGGGRPAATPSPAASAGAQALAGTSAGLVRQLHVVAVGLSRPNGLPVETFTAQAADLSARLGALAVSLPSDPALRSVLQQYAAVASQLSARRLTGVVQALQRLDRAWLARMTALGLPGLPPDQLVLPATTAPPPPDLVPSARPSTS